MDPESERRAYEHAERALDAELDESQRRAKLPPPRDAHRMRHSIPLVAVVGTIGGVLCYLIATLAVKALASATTIFAISGIVVAALGWGATGINRVRTTANDRLIDAATCALVASVVLGILQPRPLWHLFDRDNTIAVPLGRAAGLDGVPPFPELYAWGVTATAAMIAIASLVRIVLERRRA
ncbi:MAG TPA: hypothetical protein VFQ53_20685 [Kofleriaceae bacterium]|nr:hypothetical protein [Kofleriaceae bacterium]